MKTRSSNAMLLRSFTQVAFFICLSFSSFIGSAQSMKNISGTIVDGTNSPLFGVTVVEIGTTNGVVTDINGNYSIRVESEKSVLRFTSIGFVAQEVKVENQSTINVTLLEDLEVLDEVVVTGYGVQKRSDLTGSVSSVSGEDLKKVPIATIDQAMQGQAAGVNITAKSGRPGEAAQIQIRGISSINGTEPLVVIDGIPGGDLNSISPADIASIEVLKDASSAAIYGATGGNGVIIISTKKGESGKIKTSFNMYRGMEKPINQVEMMNSQEWMQVFEELQYKPERGTPTRYRNMLNYQPDTLQTYNWQDIVFDNALSENYDVSFSGGNEGSNFLVSASYNNQTGIIKASGYKRYTFRVNSEHKISDRIKFDQRINFLNTVDEGLEEWQWHNYYSNPVYNTLRMDPALPAYDENGLWSESIFSNVNPLVNLDMKDRVNTNVKMSGNFGLTIKLLKGLTYTSRFAGSLGFGESKEYEAIYWATDTDNNISDKLHQSMSRSYNYNFQNILNYNAKIAKHHNLAVMMGMEASKWWGNNISGTRKDMPSTNPNMLYFDMSTNGTDDIQNIKGSGYIGATMAYFGRVNYDYDGKYLLTANVRRDGSSSFGKDRRWGVFPSVSVGWKFTEETFFENVEMLSFGKIRFGYGSSGSNARSGFPYLSQVESTPQFRYSVDNDVTQVGTGPVQIPNPEIHWETVNMSNLGLDLTFFDNRVSFTADLFDKVNSGMLMYQEVSRIAGTYNGDYPEVNFGSIRNMGYEITIGAKKKEGELTGGVNLNFSGVKNEVLELAQDSMLAGRVHTLSPTNMTYVGAPVAQFYGFKTDGLFTMDTPHDDLGGGQILITDQPYTEVDGEKKYDNDKAFFGDVKYVDVNGDGKITNADKVNLGSPLPKLVYGFSLNMEYKGFDFSAFFNGTYGNKILNGVKQYTYYMQGNGNRAKAFANRFVPYDVVALDADGNEFVTVKANHDTDIARNIPANYNKLREFFIEDGSYLRLRNVVLGYTIPKSITSKVNIDRVRVYGGAKNLFTLTKYTGISPDVAGKTPEQAGMGILESGVDLGVYPVTKMFYFGMNFTF